MFVFCIDSIEEDMSSFGRIIKIEDSKYIVCCYDRYQNSYKDLMDYTKMHNLDVRFINADEYALLVGLSAGDLKFTKNNFVNFDGSPVYSIW